eukprot:TRINITY_DN10354_c0_g1_i2.p1 TRINITY_DN10354_c0_g1~~TRINITY_DN10354_c0_g1_i2.p1  ORF type:complete len:987 (-),score=159.28 TRINITY_DN10354_c0_g1_i2:37-2919(-)
MALSVGRGMLVLATTTAPSDTLVVPPLVLAGRVPHNKQLVELVVPPELTQWPDFHNGVASVLALRPSTSSFNRSWLRNRKDQGRDLQHENTHAGVLFGLGLLGQLPFARIDNYKYLTKKNEILSVAALLGASISARGSMKRDLSAVVALHIPSLHPPASAEIELPPLLKSAALFSLGLLYMGTNHRQMAAVLMNSIESPPSNSNRIFRNVHALCAGFGLGFLSLGGGRTSAALADLQITEHLLACLTGGTPPINQAHQQLRVLALSASAGGLRDPSSATDATIGSAAAAAASGSLSLGPDARNSSGATNPLSSWAGDFRVSATSLEPVGLNTDITAPAAAVALGLMYLKTGDPTVAAHLAPPKTRHGLDGCVPDQLLLSTWAHGLVMWHQISPSLDWIYSQVPSVLSHSLRPQKSTASVAATQCAINIKTGAALAMAIRFAGSSNSEALAALSALADEFEKALVSTRNAVQSVVLSLRAALQVNVVTTLLCAAVVMSGSGYLPLLVRLRTLRSELVGNASAYGLFMALHMALGFLFLGGGAVTLSTSNEAVAALVCALYPRWPSSPSDNRFHLQAMRHLYVLASESRCLISIDIITKQPCYLPIVVTVAEEPGTATTTQISLTTPSALPPLSSLRHISSDSPRYWPHHVDFTADQTTANQLVRLVRDRITSSGRASAARFQPLILYVQRKTGHLSYSRDPQGFLSLSTLALPTSLAQHPSPPEGSASFSSGSSASSPSRTIGTAGVPSLTAAAQNAVTVLRRSEVDLLVSFAEDPPLAAFCQFVLNKQANDQFRDFSLGLLRECLLNDTPELIYPHLLVYSVIRNLGTALSKPAHLPELELFFALSFTDTLPFRAGHRQWLASCSQTIDGFFSDLVEQLRNGCQGRPLQELFESPYLTREGQALLAKFAAWYALPRWADVCAASASRTDTSTNQRTLQLSSLFPALRFPALRALAKLLEP